MFVRKKEYERLVREAASATERERLVQVLVEQIEYLRMQLGRPTSTVSAASIAHPDPTALVLGGIPFEEQPWVGEDEEALLAMRQVGTISDDEFQRALQLARQRDHIIE